MDWTTCVICLKGGGDLRCPEDSLQSNGYEVYTVVLQFSPNYLIFIELISE